MSAIINFICSGMKSKKRVVDSIRRKIFSVNVSKKVCADCTKAFSSFCTILRYKSKKELPKKVIWSISDKSVYCLSYFATCITKSCHLGAYISSARSIWKMFPYQHAELFCQKRQFNVFVTTRLVLFLHAIHVLLLNVKCVVHTNSFRNTFFYCNIKNSLIFIFLTKW